MTMHTFSAGSGPDLYHEYLQLVHDGKWPHNDYAGWLEDQVARDRDAFRLAAKELVGLLQELGILVDPTEEMTFAEGIHKLHQARLKP